LYDWLNDPNDQDLEIDVARFIASQAIMLSLAGVPGIYVHSIFGSRNCYSLFEETGRARSLNREKFLLQNIEMMLEDESSHTSKVFKAYKHLLEIRKNEPAFDPYAQQKVILNNSQIFGLLRGSGKNQVITIINVTGARIGLPAAILESAKDNESWIDLLSEEEYVHKGGAAKNDLEAYQVLWLKRS
jgi:sucrose phosphorylase